MLNSGKTNFPNAKRGIAYKAVPDIVWDWPEQTGFAKYGFHASAGGSPGLYFLQVPHWFLALLSAGFAVAPWVKWHFGLRTMLIAMTLVTVVLEL